MGEKKSSTKIDENMPSFFFVEKKRVCRPILKTLAIKVILKKAKKLKKKSTSKFGKRGHFS